MVSIHRHSGPTPPHPDPLPGRVALVTGASRGLGRAVALALAQRGVLVALTARSEAGLQDLAETIEAQGGTATAMPADLGIATEIDTAVGTATGRLGEIDILVSNAAGLGPVGAFTGIDPVTWAASFEVNLFAPMRLARTLTPGMLSRGWGRVVSISSGAVGVPALNPGLNAYISAKGALEAHTLNLAGELAGTGVTANVVRPGLVDTAMQAWVRDAGPAAVGFKLHAQFVEWHRTGALRPPRVVAAGIVELLAGEGNGGVVDLFAG